MDYLEITQDNFLDYNSDLDYLQEVATSSDAYAVSVYQSYQLTKISLFCCLFTSTFMLVCGFRFIKGILS